MSLDSLIATGEFDEDAYRTVLNAYDEDPTAMPNNIQDGEGPYLEVKEIRQIRSDLEDEGFLERNNHGSGSAYHTTGKLEEH
jgi:hypothetical protein